MNILRYRWLYFTISLVLIAAGIGSILTYGLKLGVDFTGGSSLEITVGANTNSKTTPLDLDSLLSEISSPSATPVNSQQIQESAQKIISVGSVQAVDETGFIIKGEPITNEQKNMVISQLETDLGPIEELRFDTVGPALSKELIIKTIWSVLIAIVCITIYIWKQFKEIQYGISATLAMLHDMLMVVGLFSIIGIFWQVEVDMLFVTALLTTLTFSVHDTIVMYDRIRELKMRFPRHSFEEVLNVAVWQTFARSYNTSFTIIVMLAALVFLGGNSIRGFAIALLIGSVTGTYSSPFIAVPLLLETMKWKKKSS